MERMQGRALLVGVAIWTGALVSPASAAEELAGPDRTLSPYFFVESDDPSLDRMPLESTEVEVGIAGVIAEVTVRQTLLGSHAPPSESRVE